MERDVSLFVNPSDDAEFDAEVGRLARESRGPEDLQARLAERYPTALVRSRNLEGLPTRWYVYRDGVWRGPGSRQQR